MDDFLLLFVSYNEKYLTKVNSKELFSFVTLTENSLTVITKYNAHGTVNNTSRSSILKFASDSLVSNLIEFRSSLAK